MQSSEIEWLSKAQVDRSDALSPTITSHEMGYVYFIQHGSLSEFKVGRSKNPALRLKSLQTGSAQPLTLFASIATADAEVVERYLHGLLDEYRLEGEHFAISSDQAHDAITRARLYVDELPRRRAEEARLKELTSAQSTDEMKPATDEVIAAYERLIELSGAIASHDEALSELRAEQTTLQDMVKLEIGTARGIEGVAIWPTVEGRRSFRAKLLKERDPELYEKHVEYVLRERFNCRDLQRQDPLAYAAYQVGTPSREFRLLPHDSLD